MAEKKEPVVKKFVKNFKKNQENGARKTVLEDLFYDFNRSRVEVYKMNFVRGIMIGAGTVIGGTIVIGLLVWILTILGNFIPPLDDFLDGITNSLQGKG